MILAEITGNAIHRAELYQQSQEQVRRLTTLRDVDAAIASSFDLRLTLNILMDQTLNHLAVHQLRHVRCLSFRERRCVFNLDYLGVLAVVLPPGAFIGLGLLIAGKNWLDARAARRSTVVLAPTA